VPGDQKPRKYDTVWAVFSCLGSSGGAGLGFLSGTEWNTIGARADIDVRSVLSSLGSQVGAGANSLSGLDWKAIGALAGVVSLAWNLATYFLGHGARVRVKVRDRDSATAEWSSMFETATT
jgi:hypothetical protein